MDNVQWEGNTQKIFETAISLAPKPFRSITKKSLTEAIEKRVGKEGTVTEEIIVDCIKEVTPKPFLGMGMKKIKPLLKNA